jgi:flagella basal body P-ring formation protein FlgA
MMNPRPIGTRKTVQLMVILTLLAWATQTLFHQWGYGGLILDGVVPDNTTTATTAATAAPLPAQTPAPLPAPAPEVEPIEITIELRSQIKAEGSKLTLRDVCRWSDQDQLVLEPVADMVVTRLSDTPGVRQVTVDQIKSALHDAGVNLSAIRFSGAASCAVVVGNADVAVPVNSESAKRQAADGDRVAAPKPIVADVAQTPLKDLLLADIRERLKMSADQLQVDFDAKDAAVLAITSPKCRIDFDAGETGKTLGPVVWNVVIQNDMSEQKATIAATARAWEDQVVLTRPLSRGQAFMKNDLAPRRVLVDTPTAQPVTNVDDALGQVASRAMKRGDVLTVADTDAPVIMQAGQPITVSLKIGDNTVDTIATAMDSGKKGSAIRARNNANGDIYRVRVTALDAGTQITDDNDNIVSTGTN